MKSLSSNGLKKKLLYSACALGGLCGLHTGAMMVFESLSLVDALWLTFTTVATVGYGDLAAKTLAGRASTVGLMYAAGIAAMAQTASYFFEYRQEKRDRILNGKWKWNMEDHIVFLNCPQRKPLDFFHGLMKEFRKSAIPGAQRPAVIVSPDLKDGLPDSLRKMDVVHVNDPVTDQQAFENSSLKEAAVVVILNPDRHDPLSDSVTFDLVARVKDANPKAIIVAEVSRDESRQRFLNAGAHHVVRSMSNYPELIVRTVLAPGTEEVISEIFSSSGGEPVRYNVSLKGTWGDIASRMIMRDIGASLAYIDRDGKVISNAHPDSEIEGKAIIVLVREGNIKKDDEVHKLLTADDGAVAQRTFRPRLIQG